MRRWIVAVCVALVCPFARAALELSPLLVDGAVLQRDKPVPVWGWTTPGSAVRVTFHGQTVEAVADAAGSWSAALPAMAASAQNETLVVESDGQKRAVRDVVVGEVWLCSGQSNMQWTVSQADNAKAEMAAADFPLIRHYRVPIAAADHALDRFKPSRWLKASPQTVGQFSAVAYYFARDLHRDLKVPIGLVNASWGGKMIEVFMSPDLIASRPEFSKIGDRWTFEQATLAQSVPAYEAKLAARQTTATPGDDGAATQPSIGMHPREVVAQHRPGGVFNAMINPVIHYGVRGVLWYQGEHNIARPAEYELQFSSLIADWRKRSGQGELPFYFCQLSTFDAPLDKTHEGYALLREAQLKSQSVPNTAMAVTFDVGLGYVVHPTNKQDVGARLARIAKAKTYGMPVEWAGPTLVSAERQGTQLRLTFDHAAGLTLRGGTASSFEVAGVDGLFHSAATRVDGGSVVIDAGSVADARQVRYAWGNSPAATLFNGDGLPASPFRTQLQH